MLGKNYFNKQASILLKFAKSTTDSELSARLVKKAADLKWQSDPARDQSLRAPDIEPEGDPGGR